MKNPVSFCFLWLFVFMTAGCTPAPKPEPAPTYDYLNESLFGPKCALYTCHTPDFAQECGDLDLSGPEAYNNLVGHPSAIYPDRLRVAPGNPDESLLVNRLEGTVVVGTPLERREVTPHEIELLRSWIKNGAPR